MSYTATYGALTIDPIIRWRHVVTPVTSENGNTVTGYQHTVVVAGFLLDTTATGRAADITSIKAELTTNGNLLSLLQDGTLIDSLDPTLLRGNQPHAQFNIPDRDPVKVGFNTPFVATFTGVEDPAGAGPTLSDAFTDTYEHDKQDRITFTREGERKLAIGTLSSPPTQSELETQLANVDPGAPDNTFELESKSIRADDDGELLTYRFVYVQQHQSNPVSAATAPDVNYSVSAQIENGREVWTLAGTAGFKEGVEVDTSVVATILSASNMPGGLSIIREDTDQDDRNNVLTFTVVGEQAFGGGDVIEWEESVDTTTTPDDRVFKAMSSSDDDVRQILGRPGVVVVQAGRAVGQSTHPSPPSPINVGTDVKVVQRINKRSPFLDPSGGGVRYPVEWTFTHTPINEVEVDQTLVPPDPTTSPLEGQAASQVVS